MEAEEILLISIYHLKSGINVFLSFYSWTTNVLNIKDIFLLFSMEWSLYNLQQYLKKKFVVNYRRTQIELQIGLDWWSVI